MKKRWIINLFGLLALAGAILFLTWSRNQEPQYQGHSISWWVRQHTRRPSRFYGGDFPIATRRQMADQKLQNVLAIGTNTIPCLFDEIRRSRSLWTKLSLPRRPGTSSYRAEDAFLNATDALRMLGPDAVSILLQSLKDQNRHVRQASAIALGYIDPVEPRVIAALTGCVVAWTNDPSAACGAMQSLQLLGPRARSAVPPLESILKAGIGGRDFVSPFQAAQALAAIDPTSAVLYSTLTNWTALRSHPFGDSNFVGYVNAEAAKLLNNVGAAGGATAK